MKIFLKLIFNNSFYPSVENSTQMLTSEHNKAMREIDKGFEELKRSIPDHIRSMTVAEVMKMQSFNDFIVEEKMTNLNATMKETIEKADDGKLINFLWCIFGSHSYLSPLPHL